MYDILRPFNVCMYTWMYISGGCSTELLQICETNSVYTIYIRSPYIISIGISNIIDHPKFHIGVWSGGKCLSLQIGIEKIISS